MMEQFIKDENIQIKPETMGSLITTCQHEKIDLTLKNLSTLTIIRQYLDYRDKVNKGHLGKDAMFFLSWTTPAWSSC